MTSQSVIGQGTNTIPNSGSRAGGVPFWLTAAPPRRIVLHANAFGAAVFLVVHSCPPCSFGADDADSLLPAQFVLALEV
jgi:hypothetical protein